MSDSELSGGIQDTPARVELGRFAKGVSGNPSGRPSGGKGIATYIRERSLDGKALVDFLVDVLEGKEKFAGRERLTAAQILLDRGFGKAIDIQAIVAANPDTNEDLAQLVSDALIQLAGSFRKPLPPKSEILDLDPSASLAPQNPKPPEDT